jgi:hypothetical protein
MVAFSFLPVMNGRPFAGLLRWCMVQPDFEKQFNKTFRLWQGAFRISPGREK